MIWYWLRALVNEYTYKKSSYLDNSHWGPFNFAKYFLLYLIIRKFPMNSESIENSIKDDKCIKEDKEVMIKTSRPYTKIDDVVRIKLLNMVGCVLKY